MNHVFPRRAVPMRRPIEPMPGGAVPLVLVVESQPRLAASLGELCDFLRIRVSTVPDAEQLHQSLQLQPIAVLVHAETGPAADQVARTLEMVARHDAAMPVLLVTDAASSVDRWSDEHEASDDAATEAPRALTNLHWMASSPGIKPLVEFLFMAERRCGIPGLMPL